MVGCQVPPVRFGLGLSLAFLFTGLQTGGRLCSGWQQLCRRELGCSTGRPRCCQPMLMTSGVRPEVEQEGGCWVLSVVAVWLTWLACCSCATPPIAWHAPGVLAAAVLCCAVPMQGMIGIVCCNLACFALPCSLADVRALRSVYNAPLPVLPKLPRLPSAAAVPGAADGGTSVDSSIGSIGSSLGISSSQLRQLASEAYRAGLSPALQAAAATQPSYGGGGGGGGASANLAGSTGSVSFSDEESNGNGSGNGRGARLIERLVSSSTSTAATAAGSSAAAAADCKPGLPAGTSTSTSAAVGAGQGLSIAAEVAAEFAAGEGPVMRALGSYLRHLETAADGGSVEAEAEAAALAQAIASHDLPATPDGCFPALFGR